MDLFYNALDAREKLLFYKKRVITL